MHYHLMLQNWPYSKLILPATTPTPLHPTLYKGRGEGEGRKQGTPLGERCFLHPPLVREVMALIPTLEWRFSREGARHGARSTRLNHVAEGLIGERLVLHCQTVHRVR